MRSRATVSSLAFYISLGAVSAQEQGPPPQVAIRAPYVRTPPEVVREMLKLAKVNRNDVVYDLGCGDGRIVIAAVREFGARGVGIDIEGERVREAQANARKAGVADRVEFRQQDLFQADISEATVVTLYLLRDVNLELRPKLLRDLKPGTRIVSHSFDMGDWKPDKEVQVNGSRLYYWVVPGSSTAPERRRFTLLSPAASPSHAAGLRPPSSGPTRIWFLPAGARECIGRSSAKPRAWRAGPGSVGLP